MHGSITPMALIALALTLCAPFARAEETADVIGTAGRYGSEAGRGAIANREIADQLYKQSLTDEAQAWRTFPPNVALLSKALQQSKDAKLADDQAKEFARAALHSANTGSKSGQFSTERYGMASESELKRLATTSSPYMSQVERKLSSYGMKLSTDKMSLITPFGKFNVNMESSTFEKMVGVVAGKLGFPATDVSRGLRSAEGAREQIAQRAVAYADKKIGALHAQKGSGSGLESAPETQANAASEEAVGGRGPASITSLAEGVPVKNFEEEDSFRPKTMDEIAREVQANRRAFGQSMGIDEPDPLGQSNQNIFEMVHTRYQSMRDQGSFIDAAAVESAQSPISRNITRQVTTDVGTKPAGTGTSGRVPYPLNGAKRLKPGATPNNGI